MKFFLQEKFGVYQEVSKEDYVDAERLNGFYNTLGKPNEPATSAFTGQFHRGYTEFESLADFNTPRDDKERMYALHDARAGEVTKILVVEEE